MAKKSDILESFIKVHRLIETSNYASATKFNNKLYNQSKEIDFENGINLYYHNLVQILYFTHQNHLALGVINYLIKLYEETDNTSELAKLYRILGVLLSRLGDYSSSYYYLKKSLEMSNFGREQCVSTIVNTYNSLSYNASNLKDFDKALNYINLGLSKLTSFTEIAENKKAYVSICIAKMKVLLKKQKEEQAKTIYETLKSDKNIQIDRKETIYLYEVDILIQIAENKTSDEDVIFLLSNLLRNAIYIEDIELRIRTLYLLKEIHFNIKDYDLANKFADQLLKIHERIRKSHVDIINSQTLNKPIEKETEDFEIYLKQDLEVAARYQSNFFKENIKSQHFEFSFMFTPAKTLSGDYLGTFILQENCYLFVLADVVGKGITASYISFMLDGIIKSVIANTSSFSLKNMTNNINSILADALDGQGFVSLWAGIVDGENNSLESVNAGHLPTMFIKNDKTVVELNKGCTILGMFEELPDFQTELVAFNKGDALIAYSDGVTEAMNTNGDFYEEKFFSLVNVFAQNKDFNFIKLLEAELKLFQDKSQPKDDISCLFIAAKN